uniref:Uncharacterized protein n=1 Tax=Cucumis melo TaxID=3656 RepID=A0A9I9CKL2_CUCME
MAKSFRGYAFHAIIKGNFLNWNLKIFQRQQRNAAINERNFGFQDLRSRKGNEVQRQRYRKRQSIEREKIGKNVDLYFFSRRRGQRKGRRMKRREDDDLDHGVWKGFKQVTVDENEGYGEE